MWPRPARHLKQTEISPDPQLLGTVLSRFLELHFHGYYKWKKETRLNMKRFEEACHYKCEQPFARGNQYLPNSLIWCNEKKAGGATVPPAFLSSPVTLQGQTWLPEAADSSPVRPRRVDTTSQGSQDPVAAMKPSQLRGLERNGKRLTVACMRGRKSSRRE